MFETITDNVLIGIGVCSVLIVLYGMFIPNVKNFKTDDDDDEYLYKSENLGW